MPPFASFGRADAEPETAEELPGFPPGIAMITVVPVLDEEKLAGIKQRLTAAVAEAFREGIAEALAGEIEVDVPEPAET